MKYIDTKQIDAVNDGIDAPDTVRLNGYHVADLEYVHTDAWRGYYKIKPAQGFELLSSDWITGDWDDAPAGHGSSEQEARVDALEKKYGDVYVVLSPTSNVFSTSIDVLIRNNEAPRRKRILEGRRIANNTRLVVADAKAGTRAIKLHKTNIATETGDGHLVIDTGGWDTMTTRERIQRFTSAQPRREKGITYIDGQELVDGMKIPGSLRV